MGAEPHTILLVEDNATDAAMVELAIEHAGVQADLRILADGDAAVDYLRRMARTREPLCPDLLILDINLPAASSEEILAALRSHRSGGKTPVILITGLANPDDLQRMSKFGEYRFFAKPGRLAAYLELGNLIREALNGNRTSISSAR